MKVPERRLGSVNERMVRKDSWKDNYRQYPEDRDSYW